MTDTWVVPVTKWLNAEKGTMVSRERLTADPVEVLPRPALARELAARFRATSCATEVLDAALDRCSTVVPATACVNCVPDGAPPAVLTYKS